MLLSLIRQPLFLPDHPEGTGDAGGRIGTGNQADDKGERKGQNGADVKDKRHYRHGNHRQNRGNGGIDGAGKGLIDAHIDKLGQIHRIPVKLPVFPDTVINNDGGVDGVTEDHQQHRNKVAVQR